MASASTRQYAVFFTEVQRSFGQILVLSVSLYSHLCGVCRYGRGVRGLFLRRPASRLWHAELREAGQEVVQRLHRTVGPRQEDGIRRLR